MDFKLFLGVVKRYKRMVIAGAVLAVVLSVLSYGTPSLKGGKPTIVPRGAEIWQGEAELLISQAGFPYGRAVHAGRHPGRASTPSQPIGDYNYMASLSSVYAALANGNSVQHQAATEARVPLCPLTTGPCGSLKAAEVDDISDRGSPLPLLTVTSSAPTAADAAKLATIDRLGPPGRHHPTTGRLRYAGRSARPVADGQERIARHARPGPQQEHSDPRAVCRHVGQHRPSLHPEQPQRRSGPLHPPTPG